MTVDAHLGVLIRTASIHDTTVCAALMGAARIASAAELRAGMRAVIDLDEVQPEAAVLIGQRFRMTGTELVVAARPQTPVPYALSRNLTGA